MSQHESEHLHRYTLSTDEKPSEVVYSSVAAIENCSPLDLTPLAYAIDPEALDALLTDSSGTVHISFIYSGYDVSVSPDEIRIQKRDC